MVKPPVKVSPTSEPLPQSVVPTQQPKPQSLAIVLIKGNENYQQIANAVAQRFAGESEVFELSSPAPQASEINRLKNSKHQQVLLIGAAAARWAVDLEDRHRVFAQVFNHQQEGLLEAGFSGVSMVPDADQLFSTWKTLAPNLTHVGIITGPQNEQTIAQIKLAGQRFDIEVLHREAANDKEMLYELKQLNEEVQGYWLLPDHRILSRRTMKDFMSISVKQGKQVALFNQQLLKYGGLMYVGADPDDIAQQAIVQLSTTGPSFRLLEKAVIEINQRAVEQLNLAL